MSLFQHVEADPDEDYRLTDERGPWLIMCVTFMGNSADEDADALVHELRSKYKLKAYTHEMTFDFRKGIKGRGIDRYGEPLQMRYQREKLREVAVLVGDFAAVDDAQAQRTLKRIKTMRPVCLDENRLKETKQSSRPLTFYRLAQRELQQRIGSPNKAFGPMGHAFVTVNPLLPKDYYVPKGIDPLVLKMNKDVEYSLLKCPGKYSCKVATFTGSVLLDQKLIKEVEEQGKKLPSRLEEAAIKAHDMTMALRAKGVEAYEFHERAASIVCVGSFDSVGRPRADGQIEIDPRLHRVITTYSADKNLRPGQTQIVPKFIEVAGGSSRIPYDVQAMPVQVPRQTISAQYERPVLGSLLR